MKVSKVGNSVAAVARRRRCFFNGVDTLACFIASVSDIDDVIPILTAYQIEWNKIHTLLKRKGLITSLDQGQKEFGEDEFVILAQTLHSPIEDLERLKTVWGKSF